MSRRLGVPCCRSWNGWVWLYALYGLEGDARTSEVGLYGLCMFVCMAVSLFPGIPPSPLPPSPPYRSLPSDLCLPLAGSPQSSFGWVAVHHAVCHSCLVWTVHGSNISLLAIGQRGPLAGWVFSFLPALASCLRLSSAARTSSVTLGCESPFSNIIDAAPRRRLEQK